MYDSPEENTRNKLYIFLSEKLMTKEILWRVTIFLFIREWMREGGYSDKNKYKQKEKISCKVNEGVYFGD